MSQSGRRTEVFKLAERLCVDNYALTHQERMERATEMIRGDTTEMRRGLGPVASIQSLKRDLGCRP